MLTLPGSGSSPQTIESIDLLRVGTTWLVRSRSSQGVVGLAATTSRIEYLHPILMQRIAPFFLGRDARDLVDLIDGVYRHASNYKLAGLPFWSCVAWVEFSLLDMLGRAFAQPVSAMLGAVVRREVPVYLSLLDRKSSPAQIVEILREALLRTGAKAVKVKIGGRMSMNADASPGRSADLVSRLRRTLPEDTTICVDANGSYDADTAIAVGRMLEAEGVALFEEPCPFEHYEETRRVAAALTVPVAGGEQDSSVRRWQTIMRDHVFDVIQPDVIYNGGLLRTAHVLTMANADGYDYPVSLHNPHAGPSAAYALHVAAVAANPWSFHEVNVTHRPESWYEPQLTVANGVLRVPTGPGLGVDFDAAVIARATIKHRIARAARTFIGWMPGIR